MVYSLQGTKPINLSILDFKVESDSTAPLAYSAINLSILDFKEG